MILEIKIHKINILHIYLFFLFCFFFVVQDGFSLEPPPPFHRLEKLYNHTPTSSNNFRFRWSNFQFVSSFFPRPIKFYTMSVDCT